SGPESESDTTVRQDSAPNSTSVTPRPASQAADGTANSDSPAPPAPPNAADAQARAGQAPAAGQANQQDRGQQAQSAPTKATPAEPKDDEARKESKTRKGADSRAPASCTRPGNTGETEGRETGEVEYQPMRGAAARTASNMDESLSVPTATSVRSVPVK